MFVKVENGQIVSVYEVDSLDVKKEQLLNPVWTVCKSKEAFADIVRMASCDENTLSELVMDIEWSNGSLICTRGYTKQMLDTMVRGMLYTYVDYVTYGDGYRLYTDEMNRAFVIHDRIEEPDEYARYVPFESIETI